ncbi:MAG: excinuclease ABC subunit A, partial [Gemmataceae bacterium]|nr:excinuclease ABC subunit A [Gemmataceae bacterium]
EAQRIRLASQIGSGLTGVLYVLDEPTIGLHPRDNRRLIQALNRLRDLGNTLLLVEHDREVIDTADYLLDFGPGAGDRGGEIVAQGSPKQVKRARDSLTGSYLSGRKAIPVPTNRRIADCRLQIADSQPATAGQSAVNNLQSAMLVVKGARHNNLQNIDVPFPLGCFVAVTGVSGSGKSSLVNEVLYHTLARKLHRARTPAAAHDAILGLEQIDKVINVDQDPIGNSPSSNPATYTGVFDLVRHLFARLPDAKIRGYQPTRFSFNKPGGRCEACEGSGQKRIEMHFLPDVWVECEECHGTRYNPETLQVRFKGHSIADVLNMRVAHALEVFQHIPKIRAVLQTLADVGLDYVSLGQAAPTLSGGEAQRVKLAAELSRPSTGRTVYILDEPTTGLHFDDIRKLLDVLNRLADLGNTVIVIEHNMDVIKTADWVIDLGPEAGSAGGRVVAAGSPEQVVQQYTAKVGSAGESATAPLLAEVLAASPHAERPRFKPLEETAEEVIDIEATDLGEDAKLPWEVDGPRWHTKDRVGRTGKPCTWEGEALAWVIERIHEAGKFGSTSWTNRTIVEIAAPVRSQGWFLHASTGDEKLLWLTFRVARNSFKVTYLREELGIHKPDETPDIGFYGTYERVRVKNMKGPWQSVEIGVRWQRELDTPGFKAFLQKAVSAFETTLKRMATKPEDVMPWKINGERWHLSDKGFPPGKPPRWSLGLLPRLVALVKEIVPEIEINWTTRDAITLRPKGAKYIWARWVTKDPAALICNFSTKKGQLNLARLEHFIAPHELLTDKDCSDVLRFEFRTEEQLQTPLLRELLTEQVRWFLEVYG